MTIQIRWVLLGALVLAWAYPPPVALADPCNFQSTAHSWVSGSSGNVQMEFLGQVTRFDCIITPRRFLLRSEALRNNNVIWVDRQVGNNMVRAGQTFWRAKPFFGCDSVWVAVAKSGYRQYGFDTHYATFVSGPYFSNCAPPPPPPPGCDLPYQDTVTLALSAGRAPEVAAEQLGVALTRSRERPEGMFLMEEWALVDAGDGGSQVRLATTNAFKERVGQLAGVDQLAGGGKVLFVEAPRHAENANRIPMPTAEPVDVVLPASHGGGEFWFRAEVSAEGVVDRLMMLDDTNAFAEREVRAALKENMALSYADERRHRMVVFGVAKLDGEGRLRVDDPIVIPPQCCCIDNWCP